MNIIVRILTGILQDQSPTSSPYKKVTPVYVALSVISCIVSVSLHAIFILSKYSELFKSIYVDVGRLQWTRKQRIQKGNLINERKLVMEGGEDGKGNEKRKMNRISRGAFTALMCLVLGSRVAYFWGVAMGNNE
jgi:Fe-S cluster biosynthesis and repair protein YggX